MVGYSVNISVYSNITVDMTIKVKDKIITKIAISFISSFIFKLSPFFIFMAIGKGFEPLKQRLFFMSGLTIEKDY